MSTRHDHSSPSPRRQAVGSGDSTRTCWRDRLQHAFEDLEAAFDWLLDHGQAGDVLRMASTLAEFLRITGRVAIGRGWLDRALAAAALDDRLRAAAPVRERAAGLLAGRRRGGVLAAWAQPPARTPAGRPDHGRPGLVRVGQGGPARGSGLGADVVRGGALDGSGHRRPDRTRQCAARPWGRRADARRPAAGTRPHDPADRDRPGAWRLRGGGRRVREPEHGRAAARQPCPCRATRQGGAPDRGATGRPMADPLRV